MPINWEELGGTVVSDKGGKPGIDWAARGGVVVPDPMRVFQELAFTRAMEEVQGGRAAVSDNETKQEFLDEYLRRARESGASAYPVPLFKEVSKDIDRIQRAYWHAAYIVHGSRAGVRENPAAARAIRELPKEDRDLLEMAVADVAKKTGREAQDQGTIRRTIAGLRSGVKRTVERTLNPAGGAGGDLHSDESAAAYRNVVGTMGAADPITRPDDAFYKRWTTSAAEMTGPMLGTMTAMAGGGPVSGALFTANYTYPDSYDTMRSRGIKPEIAAPAATASAIIQGAIETLEMFPGVGKEPGGRIGKALSKKIDGVIAKKAIEYATSFGKEWTEEGLQGLVDSAATEVAAIIDPKAEAKAWNTPFKEAVASMVQSAGPLAVFMSPGVARGMSRTVLQKIQADQNYVPSRKEMPEVPAAEDRAAAANQIRGLLPSPQMLAQRERLTANERRMAERGTPQRTAASPTGEMSVPPEGPVITPEPDISVRQREAEPTNRYRSTVTDEKIPAYEPAEPPVTREPQPLPNMAGTREEIVPFPLVRRSEAKATDDGAAPEPVTFGDGVGFVPPSFVSVDMIAKKGRRGLDTAKEFIKEWFFPGGKAPKPIRVAEEKKIAQVRSALKDVQNKVNDARAVLKGMFKNTGIVPEQHFALINDVLQKKQPMSSLPPELVPHVQNMRDAVDRLSTLIRDEPGLVSDDMKVVLGNNLGMYLTRTFRAFTDPNYEATPEDREYYKRAHLDNLFIGDYTELRDYVKTLNGMGASIPLTGTHSELTLEVRQAETDMGLPHARQLTDAQMEHRIEAVLQWAREAGEMGPIYGNSKSLGKNMDIFRERKASPELRALLGEETDPFINVIRSASKMATVLANHQMLAKLATDYRGVLFFDPLDAPPEASALISKADNARWAPLDGLYTSPEVKEALKGGDTLAIDNPILRGVVSTFGAIKIGKTVLNPRGQIRNITSNPLFMLQQGNFSLGLKELPDALRTISAYLGFNTSDNARELLDYAIRNRLVGESIVAQEFIRLYDTVLKGDVAASGWKEKAKIPFKVYEAGDSLFKILQHAHETQQYRDALGLTQQQAEEMATEIVLDTLPTYSRLPKIIQAMRLFPIAGNFFAFPYEVMRTTYNTIKLIKRDMADARTRPIAYRRMLGMAMAQSVGFGIQAATMALFGISDDEDEAVRNTSADWTKNSLRAYTGKKDGEYTFFDLSQAMPFGVIHKPLVAMMRNQPWRDALTQAVSEAFGWAFDEPLWLKPLSDIAYNDDGRGNPVYNPQDPDRGWAMFYHWLKNAGPSVINDIKNLNLALTGELNRRGEARKLPTEIASLVLGQRTYTTNIATGFGRQARDYGKSMQDANRLLRYEAQSLGTVTPEQLKKKHADMEAARRRLWDGMRNNIRLAKIAGMSDDELFQGMNEVGGISKDEAARLLNGMYLPYMYDKGFIFDVPKMDVNEAMRRREVLDPLVTESLQGVTE